MRALTLLVAIGCAAMPRAAGADPATARVLTAPTAWVPAPGSVTATLGLDHRADGSALVSYGLGGLAAIELGSDTDVRTCTQCDEPPEARWFGRAAFRLGAHQDAWFRGMPALALGLRNTFATRGFGPFERPRVTEAYAVASRAIGRLTVHAGASLITAGYADQELSPRLRPLAGIEYIPPQFPRTSLVADLAWTARLEEDPVLDRRGPRLEWVGGLGVRYQALAWSAIELAVRTREDDGLSGSTVLIRLHATSAAP
ncbi:MAG: hypothetical protein ACTHU0_30255 [Kofleriaceae bacterium]